MLWDPSFQSWVHFGVSGQPASVLVNREGDVVQKWSGAIPENTVLNLAAGL